MSSSEKQLENALEEIYHYIETVVPVCRSYPLRQVFDIAEQALAASEPDLVVVLREVRERAEKGGERFRRTFASDTREQLRGICAALDSLDDYICEQIRLTDDGGWEWVEDGE